MQSRDHISLLALPWVSTLVFLGVTTLWAQDVQGDAKVSRSAAKAAPTIPTAEATYGSVILLSLFQLEPIESLDEWASHELARNVGDANVGPRWGGRWLGSGAGSLGIAATPLVYGILAGDSRARGVGLRALESLYTAAFLARALKMGVGRARPGQSSEPDVFAPLNSSPAFHSFPSGHTSRAFAVAATLARELGEDAPWVPYVAYSMATWTAATRVMDGAHWSTDVAAGAALGLLASSFVDRLNRTGHEGLAIDVRPLYDGATQLGVRVRVP